MGDRLHKSSSICLIVSLFLNFLVQEQAQARPSRANHKAGGGKVEVVAKDRPNILFILTDDQRLEDIQHMPTLQKLLVSQGMSFTNYFSNVSLCCPSRTSILRGQCAHNTGVLTNGEPNGGFDLAHRLGLEDSTIATWMHGAGYRTALIGKYLNRYPGSLGPSYIPPGWDYWASAVEGNPYSEYNYTLNENGKSVSYGRSAKDYGTDVYTGKAIDFIKGAADDHAPFFMYLAFYAPHGPATPAPRHVGMFTDLKITRSDAFNEKDVSAKPQYIQRLAPLSDAEIHSEDAYYAKRLSSLQAVDEAIGNLFKTLSETKQLDNTYVIFAADNGFHLGEHRLRRGKQTAYETDIHLPLIVRGPGIKSGARAEQIAGNIDLAPTFAALGGATPPDFVDGRSLVPILKGAGSDGLKWRNTFLVEHAIPGRGRRNKQKASASTIALAAYGDEEAAELAEASSSAKGSAPADDSAKSNNSGKSNDPDKSNDSVPGEESTSAGTSQMKDEEGDSEMPAPRGRRARRRARRAATGGGEQGRIPVHQGLRSPDTLYVEYDTGEREYYRLTDDSDETKNLIGKPEAKDTDVQAERLKLIKSSAGKITRELESVTQ